MKLKPYPKYKDSGINWIGKIPEEWEVRKSASFGFFSSSGINKKTESDEALVKMVNYTDIYGNNTLVIDSKRELMTVSCPKGKVIYCNLKKGDIVFTPSSETEEDIGLSAVILEDLQNTVFSYHVIRFRPSININLLYKKYIGNNHFVLSQFSRTCKGTARQILTHNDFKNILMILPPPSEQTAIANFLDKKTANIDTLIEKNKKLIELLKERRTALINHAVTKGLDPNAKMKDSGIKWISKIPEEWEVRKLKYTALIRISNIDKKSKPNEEEVLLCNYNEVYNNESITSNLSFMNATASIGQIYKFSIKKGDVIITKDSETPEDIAVPSLVEENLNNIVCGYHLALIRPNESRIKGEFLLRIFQSRKINDQFFISANGVTRFGISTYPIKNSFVIVPPLSEQTAIANFLDKATAKIDKTIKLIEQKIKLLQEYKKSLIHHTVTGKIDVRGVKV